MHETDGSSPGCPFTGPTTSALRQIEAIHAATLDHLRNPIQFPEAGVRLDIVSRQRHASRQFKHIHQGCLMHATHFEYANKIKTACIMEQYLQGVASLNPISLCSAARCLLELHAMVVYVDHLLREAARRDGRSWLERGQAHFSVIVRARFGTTDPVMQEILRHQAADPTLLEPLRLKKARELLSRKMAWVEPYYAALCDSVHHNLSSQRRVGTPAGICNVARSSSGGMLLLGSPAPILEYRFPLRETGIQAVEATAQRVMESLLGVVEAVNGFPRTPFTTEELQHWTGSRLGLTIA